MHRGRELDDDGREAADRPGPAQADQRARHRAGGERVEREEVVQSSRPLHGREGPQRGHRPRLLPGLGAHRPRPPHQPMDSHPAALLRERPEGRSVKSSAGLAAYNS